MHDFDILEGWAKLSDEDLKKKYSPDTRNILHRILDALGDDTARKQEINSDKFVQLIREMRLKKTQYSRELAETILRASKYIDTGEADKARREFDGFIASCPSTFHTNIAQNHLGSIKSDFEILDEWAGLKNDELKKRFSSDTRDILHRILDALGDDTARKQEINSDKFVQLIREVRLKKTQYSRELAETILRASEYIDTGEADKARREFDSFIARCKSKFFKQAAGNERKVFTSKKI